MGTERGQKSEDKKRIANSTQASNIARVQLSLTVAALLQPGRGRHVWMIPGVSKNEC